MLKRKRDVVDAHRACPTMVMTVIASGQRLAPRSAHEATDEERGEIDSNASVVLLGSSSRMAVLRPRRLVVLEGGYGLPVGLVSDGIDWRRERKEACVPFLPLASTRGGWLEKIIVGDAYAGSAVVEVKGSTFLDLR